MSNKNVTLTFEQGFKGTLEAENGRAAIGVEKDTLAPYDMLLGALGSCLYATFLEIVNKKRLTFENVNIEIQGVKRETVPTTLETVAVTFIVKEASKPKGFQQALKLATEYCSVYQTIAKVADMSYEIEFL
jgi:putative redox protein